MNPQADRDAFIAAVRRSTPQQAEEFAAVLDELLRWSEQHDWAIQFMHHEGSQAVVKYCVPGVATPFWSAWPRQADGAKLCVLTDPHPRFPEADRDMARRELAALDGRTPEPTEVPTVSFQQLLSGEARRRVRALMCRLLCRVCGPADRAAGGAAGTGA